MQTDINSILNQDNVNLTTSLIALLRTGPFTTFGEGFFLTCHWQVAVVEILINIGK